jgi:hypothetical protein
MTASIALYLSLKNSAYTAHFGCPKSPDKYDEEPLYSFNWIETLGRAMVLPTSFLLRNEPHSTDLISSILKVSSLVVYPIGMTGSLIQRIGQWCNKNGDTRAKLLDCYLEMMTLREKHFSNFRSLCDHPIEHVFPSSFEFDQYGLPKGYLEFINTCRKVKEMMEEDQWRDFAENITSDKEYKPSDKYPDAHQLIQMIPPYLAFNQELQALRKKYKEIASSI